MYSEKAIFEMSVKNGSVNIFINNLNVTVKNITNLCR